MVQFGLILRDPEIVDTDTANGFESDNDRDGSNTTPITKAIFSNISGFGSAKDLATFNAVPQNHKEGAALRIRRNSRISVYNSLFLGWGRGVRFESSGTHTAAQSDEMTVKNTIIGGVFGNKFQTDNSVLSAAQLESWFLAAERKNKMLDNLADARISDPFNLSGTPNFQPQAGSPVFNASYWVITSAGQIPVVRKEGLALSYPNPFSHQTSIELTLEEESHVHVMVYSINGSVVAELHNGVMYRGINRLSLDGSGLSKGIYLSRIVIGNEVQTLKLVRE